MSVKAENKTEETLQVGNKPLEEVVKEFRKYLEAYPSKQGKQRSEGTIDEYIRIVNRLAEWLTERGIKDFKSVTSKDLEQFVLNYRSRRSRKSGNSEGDNDSLRNPLDE